MSVEVKGESYDHIIGETLADRYKIEMRLGEGAMGAVYRAKHVKVGRVFAVKVLHPRLLEDTKVVQRFDREAELAGRLRHPNVIGVVDVGETSDGMRYMVMEFAEGPDLASVLAEAAMPSERVIHLTRQILDGLSHAHEQGLIHRDLKPENIIVERDANQAEVPRIVDFGIAILREGGGSAGATGRLTTNGLVLGTPHYMAPEQAVADPIDHRIDLFALGIIVYEMLSGKLPFDGSGVEVARANLLLDPPPMAVRAPQLEVDPLLEAFARRLMAKRRDRRPATARSARELLDLIERDRPAAAAALGVTLDATRAPATTQPSAPIRHSVDHEGTFPPPLSADAPTPEAQVDTTLKVRAVSNNEHHISTEASPAMRRRRTPIIAAAIAGLGILAGAGVIILSTHGDRADKVAAPAPTAPAHEAVTATPEEPRSPGEPQVVGVGSAIEPPGSGGGKPVAMTVASAPAKATKIGTKKPIAKPEAQVIASPEPKRETPVVEVQPQHLDANALAARYQRVGAQLRALEQTKGAEVATELRSRYRFVRISEAMSTQEKRDEAAEILAKLTREIAALTK